MKTTIINYHSGKNYNVMVGRPSKWGNPFVIGRDGTREEVIEKYRKYAIGKGLDKAAKKELKGKVLACYCKPLACHGDLLVEWAES